MNQLIPLFLVIVALAGCQPTATQETDPPATEAERLYAEAMEIHDDVMPRMEEMMQLKQKLQLRINALEEEDLATQEDSLRQIKQAVQRLKEADEAMMQWIRSVQPVMPTERFSDKDKNKKSTQPIDTTGITEIQRKQKAQIVEVKERMEKSISEAQQLIGLPE